MAGALPALEYSPDLGAVVPLASSRWWGGRTRHSDWVLVAGEAAELLPQGLEAGPLLRVPVPAHEHQPVGTGRALGGAGHAVARVHPREGLVVGHACGEGGRGLLCLLGHFGHALTLCTPHTHFQGPPDSTQVLRMVSRLQVLPTLPGPSTWIGRLAPAENLVEENPEGPDVRLDGIVPAGECLWGRPLVGDVAVVGKVDVLL